MQSLCCFDVLKKPLRIYGGEILPAGAETTLTGEWESIRCHVRSGVILDPRGDRRLVLNEELEYALGAH